MKIRKLIFVAWLLSFTLSGMAQEGKATLTEAEMIALDKSAAAQTNTQVKPNAPIDLTAPELAKDADALMNTQIKDWPETDIIPQLSDEMLASQESDDGITHPVVKEERLFGTSQAMRNDDQPPGETPERLINRRLLKGDNTQPEGAVPERILNRRTIKGPNTQPPGDQKKPAASKSRDQVQKPSSNN